eukprot:8117250-Alexandrium_andersonii.AAC.1
MAAPFIRAGSAVLGARPSAGLGLLWEGSWRLHAFGPALVLALALALALASGLWAAGALAAPRGPIATTPSCSIAATSSWPIA